MLLSLLMQDTTATLPPDILSGGFLGVLMTYHLAIAIGLGSAILFGAIKVFPAVAALGDWTKRATLFIATLIVIVAIRALGGETPADLAQVVNATAEAFFGALVSGAIFRSAKVQSSGST
jgi:hypothetical protein